MEKLIKATAAYAAFKGDVKKGRISHAYMLHFGDAKNTAAALKIFALAFFGAEADDADGRRILNGTFSDLRIYPEEGRKFNVESAARLVADCALKPLERDAKLYIISGFEEATPLVQNKLLKTLEEPPEGVYFLIGTTALAPVLTTVKSRVKTLTVPPFTEDEIFAALERRGANPLNKSVSESCGGILGVAENMIEGGWFGRVTAAAEEICSATDLGTAGELSVKYGDTKYKAELLSAISLCYRRALLKKVNGEKGGLETPALILASEQADRANRDLKFNANFQALLLDIMTQVIKENEKWSKLLR